MGLSSLSYYTTELEIEHAEDLFRKNRPAFLKYCRIVIEDRRTWEGEFMAVDPQLLKQRLHVLLETHDRETSPIVPGFRPDSRKDQ